MGFAEICIHILCGLIMVVLSVGLVGLAFAGVFCLLYLIFSYGVFMRPYRYEEDERMTFTKWLGEVLVCLFGSIATSVLALLVIRGTIYLLLGK